MVFNTPVARGGGQEDTTPIGFSSFSREWEELLFQTKCLAAGLSLGHLSMKKLFRSDAILDLKLDKGRVPPPIEQKLTYFSNHEDDIQS